MSVKKYWVYNRTKDRWLTSSKMQPPVDFPEAERLWKIAERLNANSTYEIRSWPNDDAPVTVRSVEPPPMEGRCKVSTCGAKNDCGVVKCWKCETPNPC